jgi:hypothetical protein
MQDPFLVAGASAAWQQDNPRAFGGYQDGVSEGGHSIELIHTRRDDEGGGNCAERQSEPGESRSSGVRG